MSRKTKLWGMGAILALTAAVAAGAALTQHHMDRISRSGEVILAIPTESVTGLSWDYGDETLTFAKTEDWTWEADEAFPVSGETLTQMLEPFTDLTADFIIDHVEDYGQYGLDEPECTIRVTAGEETTEIRLGAYSTMDRQRYADVGDGNVYLLQEDPMPVFNHSIRDVIDADRMPDLSEADRITFTGAENYTIEKQPEDGVSHRADDLYFARTEDGLLPLNTPSVADYLRNLTAADLSDYETYTASREDLSQWGLAQPELTVQVDYTLHSDAGDTEDSFTLSIGLDPEALEKSRSAEDPDSVPVPVYGRLNQSEIIFKLAPSAYDKIIACGADDLRHREILPAEAESIREIQVTLDGAQHVFTGEASGEDGEMLFRYEGREVDFHPVMIALKELRAESFTGEAAKSPLELTVALGLEDGSRTELAFYRKDGESCLAAADGRPFALVPRSQVVNLAEKVRAIVLTPAEETAEP